MPNVDGLLMSAAGGAKLVWFRALVKVASNRNRTRSRTGKIFDNPAETAIEVFAKHQLVINRKTAETLGLTIPAELLKRADRIIE